MKYEPLTICAIPSRTLPIPAIISITAAKTVQPITAPLASLSTSPGLSS